MRMNRYKTERFSLGNPCWEISSRCDLREKGEKPFGGIDSKVVSGELIGKDVKRLMRMNRYKTERFSLGNPCWEISSRCDLREKGEKPFGGIDSKVVSGELIGKDVVHAVSGPSSDDGLPTFKFLPKWKFVPRLGMPDVWNFNWTTMKTHSF
eukprot:TRINITY_DN3268_c1_g1_i1.p1 TRINITY_DN3268_c1_g1~~TRINITY_DN3268_c1_g1_i1.p1  ORF type:complete len:162 (-),score=40.14 TRINITY_DN3268_c1_g1_i1:788-1243(-)